MKQIKDFLNLSELADYLNDGGFDFDIDHTKSKIKLLSILKEKVLQHKLQVVHYLDARHISYEPDDDFRKAYFPTCSITGYFVVNSIFMKITHVTESVSLTPEYYAWLRAFRIERMSLFCGRKLLDKDELVLLENEANFCFDDNFHDERIYINDFLFPTSQIDSIFFDKPLALINDDLRLEVAELKRQLKNAKRLIRYYKADKSFEIEVGMIRSDERLLVLLGAVLNCLKDVTKPKFKQQHLVTAITKKYPNIKNLSESTIKKRFSESKNYLNHIDT